KGIGFKKQALVDGFRPHARRDGVRSHDLDIPAPRNAVFNEPARGIICGAEAADVARGIFQRRFDGVPAVEDDRPIRGPQGASLRSAWPRRMGSSGGPAAEVSPWPVPYRFAHRHPSMLAKFGAARLAGFPLTHKGSARINTPLAVRLSSRCSPE